MRGSHRRRRRCSRSSRPSSSLGFAVFYVFEMVTGATDDLTRAATSGVLILVFGVGLLALARGWFRAADWPRTPTVLWNALLLPVAWSLRESGRTAVALAVGRRRAGEHRGRRVGSGAPGRRDGPTASRHGRRQLSESQSFQPLWSTSQAMRP